MNRAERVTLRGISIPVYAFNTVVVGSGAAGLNAADYLWRQGQRKIALITEGMNLGTSRNTGSDKQTYYRINTSGEQSDSVREMAKALFDGGCMDGDIALVEAALSSQSFYHLVDIGVPFPHNTYGEFIGYKTDHDPCKRGTSAGPLTSKYMTEHLQKMVASEDIPIFDGYHVIELLTDENAGRAQIGGVLALNVNHPENPSDRYAIFISTNVIYATGGEAGIYEASVYPAGQNGGTGAALRAGVRAKNLTEWQYGIAAVAHRWNLSGTFQQVLPRYVSTNLDGNDEREFLDEYFTSPEDQLKAIFLKGYHWPFDAAKAFTLGSSLIDILVYHESIVKRRKVYLDYSRNPSCALTNGEMDHSKLNGEAYSYLEQSQALLPTPYQRLAQMNPSAVDFFKSRHVDLSRDWLEIAVCAQHNNGGLLGNHWWESNVRHFFPVGEANGTHGVYRPGGSALNSGQVGGIRAAQYIVQHYSQMPDVDKALVRCEKQMERAVTFGERALDSDLAATDLELESRELRHRMSKYGATIRTLEGLQIALAETELQMERLSDTLRLSSAKQLFEAYRLRDALFTQYVCLCAMKEYIEHGGKSRGSYLVYQPNGKKPAPNLPDDFIFSLANGELSGYIQEVEYKQGKCHFFWRKTRAIPKGEEWFETTWKVYLQKEHIV